MTDPTVWRLSRMQEAAESVSITMVVVLFGYGNLYSQLERDPRRPGSTASTAALSAALILCPVLRSRLAGRDPFPGLGAAIGAQVISEAMPGGTDECS